MSAEQVESTKETTQQEAKVKKYRNFKRVPGKHVIYSYRLEEEYDPETQNAVMVMELSKIKLSSEPIARVGECVHEVTLVDGDGNVFYTIQFLASSNGTVTARLSTKTPTEQTKGMENYCMIKMCTEETNETELAVDQADQDQAVDQ